MWAEEPIHRGSEYQAQVTGAPIGRQYIVPAPWKPEGRHSQVKFDGYDAERNVLIDSKDWKPAGGWPPTNSDGELYDWALELQARDQEQVAIETGCRVEWHVPTQEKADELIQFLKDGGFKHIDVVVTPYD